MRFLGRARKKIIIKEYMTADIETDSRNGSALLGEPVYISWCVNGVGYGEKNSDFTKWLVENFLNFKYNGWILYMHNGFGFDYKRINWKMIAKLGYTADFLSGNDGSIKSITIYKDGNEWILRDTLLLIPMKLDKLTKTFSPEQTKKKRELSFEEKPFDPDDSEDVEYAIQDSVALYTAVENVDRLLRRLFHVSIHSGSTLPSIAFRAFRLMFEKGERYPGISFALANAARESYHGGQTIAFRTVYYADTISLDANSMYPYVMLRWGLPTGEVSHFYGLAKGAHSDRTLVFAVVHIPEGVFPLLKTKNKKGIVGNYNGVVSGWYWLFELEEQKKLGASYEVIESYSWSETTHAAKRFSKVCHDLRMSDYHGGTGAVAKLLNNSLYGKFAQSVAEYVLVLSAEEPKEAVPLYEPISGKYQEYVWYVPSEPSFSADMTHWASFITAKARVILTQAIDRLGFEHIIYCDTDSIFFERNLLHVPCPECRGAKVKQWTGTYIMERNVSCPACNSTGNIVRGIMGNKYGQFKVEKGTEEKGIPFRAIAPKAYTYTDDEKMVVRNKGIPTVAILKSRRLDGKVEYVQSNNLSQMIKRGTGYGRMSARQLATEQSTTNGRIENQIWKPSPCEIRTIEEIRGQKTSSYLRMKYDRLIEDYTKLEG